MIARSVRARGDGNGDNRDEPRGESGPDRSSSRQSHADNTPAPRRGFGPAYAGSPLSCRRWTYAAVEPGVGRVVVDAAMI